MKLPDEIGSQRVIPVARGLTVDRAGALVRALADGGIETLEVTMESGTAPEVIASLAGSGSTVGAGTVIGIDAARAAAESGARFLVSPHFDPKIAAWSQEHGVFYLPGVFTATEAAAALGMGLGAVKLFPASVGGPELVRSLLGPFPSLGIVPSGGIDASNAGAFMAAGAIAVGVGGWLTDHDDLQVVTERAAQLRQVV